jgi:hypothetical protein
VNISECPAEADGRAVPGGWDGGLVFGKQLSPVATLVERSTRYLLFLGLPGEIHRPTPFAGARPPPCLLGWVYLARHQPVRGTR